jgi:hypothetical protein
MEGVYRAGEFYLRWLESCSSLFFGTTLGRFVTRNLAVPFGGAYALLEGLALMTNRAVQFPWYAFLPLGAFILGLIHSKALRDTLAEAGAWGFRGLRLVFYEVPARLWRLPWLQGLLRSWPVLLLFWYVGKPLVVYGLLWLRWPARFSSPPVAAVTFLIADLVLNSRFGSAISEAFGEALVLAYSRLRFDVLQGLFRVVSRFFKRVTDTVEYVLYTVDEMLRFRSDENRLMMAVRAAAGVLWFPVGFLVRLYFVMLLEPTLNPIKLPLSSLSFKFMVLMPWYRDLLVPGTHEALLIPYTGWGLAAMLTFAILIPTAWLLPGAFTFFFWEMQANWRLFRANRPGRLRPVMVGSHGETMLQLLKPGFHSGTVPRLFAQLRAAERGAYLTGIWRSARTYRQALHEVEHSVRLFIEREFLALLNQSKSWAAQPLHVGSVVLSCTRIRVELVHEAWPGEPVWLAFEERSGWLIGSLHGPGWLRHLAPGPRQVLTTALAGLYKIAGVDLVREQLAALLPGGTPGYDVTDHRLVVWTDAAHRREIAYDLLDRHDELWPRQANGKRIDHLPTLDARRLFFSRLPLTWHEWEQCWQLDQEGKDQPAPLGGMRLLPLAGPAPIKAP